MSSRVDAPDIIIKIGLRLEGERMVEEGGFQHSSLLGYYCETAALCDRAEER